MRARPAVAAAALAAAFLSAGLASAQSSAPLLPAGETGVITYFIGDGDPATGFKAADRELAEWAIAAWRRAGTGLFRLEPAPADRAMVRLLWAPPAAGQYGEMRASADAGRPSVTVVVRPDTDALGPDIAALARGDPLFRDTIVYLTCVHELGHAFGLPHTADFSDIMYFFGYGGDIPAFFGRYRDRLERRADIARYTGMSPNDVAALRAVYDPAAQTR